MARDDLREHSHTKPGDGGELPIPTVAAEGTETIAANGSGTISTGITDEAGIYDVRVGVAGSGSGLDGTIAESTSATADGSGAFLYNLGWNNTAGEYEINFDSGVAAETDFDWKVYEL